MENKIEILTIYFINVSFYNEREIFMSYPKCGLERVERLDRGTKEAARYILDSTVLDNRKCNFCNHEWHE